MTPDPSLHDTGSGPRAKEGDRLRPNGGRAPGSDQPANWGLALDLGMRLGISVFVGLGAGLLLDGWLKTGPLFTLIGVALGFAAAMYTIWDVAREAMRR